MKLNFSRDWLKWAAETEDGCDVSAGVKALPRHCGENHDQVAGESSDVERQRLERNRLRYYIRLLIGDWGKVVTRSALDGGLILMLDDNLRAALLEQSLFRQKTDYDGSTLEGLNYVLQELEIAGQIEIDNGHIQQRLKLKMPFQDAVSQADRQRLQEVKQVFEAQRQLGKVVETEEVLDAHLELVSA
ncbi:MAG: hypothetical protein R3C49_01505 [Planctomycetaceae bacterium]